MTQLKTLVQAVERSVIAQFLLTLVLITCLKWEALFELPTWDTAMGVFPPAFTLVDNGFDLVSLLAMPDFLHGGPNVHSSSVVTLLTAFVLKLVGAGGHAYVVLHLLHFAVTAAALLTLFRVARPVFGGGVTLLFCLSVLLQPVFSTQVGYLYLEMPLFLSAVCALHAWIRQRFWLAVFWATLAYAIKDPGIIVPVALAVAALLESRGLGQRVKRASIILAIPVVLRGAVTVLSVLRLTSEGGEYSLFPSPADAFGQLLDGLSRYLVPTPDVLLLLMMVPTGIYFWGRGLFKALRREPSEPDLRTPKQQEQLAVAYSGLLVLMFVLLSYVGLPLLLEYTVILPRYHVMVLPFLILWAGYQLKEVSGRREWATAGGFALLCVLFGLNSSGRLYPADVGPNSVVQSNEIAITERSNAYRRLNAIQLDAMAYLEDELPDGALVYYGLYEHYLFNYPGLGYAKAPLTNGHTFFLEPLSDLVAQKPFPSCTYVVYNYHGLGGEQVYILLNQVAPREGLSTEVLREFRDDPYKITISLVRRPGAVCPHDQSMALDIAGSPSVGG